MPRFRSLKNALRTWFRDEKWSKQQPLPAECEDASPLSLANALFACLTEGGTMAERAAFAMGGVMAKVYADSPEDAKNIVRRYMWHMRSVPLWRTPSAACFCTTSTTPRKKKARASATTLLCAFPATMPLSVCWRQDQTS